MTTSNHNTHTLPRTLLVRLRFLAALATIAIALCLVAAAYGGYLDPREHSGIWTLATLAFPAVLVADALIAVVWLLFRHWRLALIPIVAIVASWPTVWVNCPLNLPHSVKPGDGRGGSFTLLTFNVMSYSPLSGDYQSPSKTMRYILKQNADFVITQETSLGPGDFTGLPWMKSLADSIKRAYPYRMHGYHDVELMSKYPFKVIEDSVLPHAVIPADEISCEYRAHVKAFDVSMPNGRQLRLVGVHLQSTGIDKEGRKMYVRLTKFDDENLHAVRSTIVSKLSRSSRGRAMQAQNVRGLLDDSPANVILTGDFNDVPGSWAYRTVRGHDMRDAWADCGTGLTHTFHNYRMLFHIDHVLYRGSLEATGIRRDKAGDSDHYPVLTSFRWKN